MNDVKYKTTGSTFASILHVAKIFKAGKTNTF